MGWVVSRQSPIACAVSGFAALVHASFWVIGG
jgi:hypothetical protein